MNRIEALNALSRENAIREFEKCCGARAFAEKMADSRPYPDSTALYQRAERVWSSLSPSDWREAFDHHPRIGGAEELRKKFSSTAEWASEEQSGVASASSDVIARLAEGNARYEGRFGHIFLVCATGKSAVEMLGILEERMKNDPDSELLVAAREQAKITKIRLEKLIS